MITSVRAQLILLENVRERDFVDRILVALEQEPALQPTHWGVTSGIRDPYAREAVLEAVKQAAPGSLVPHVRRMRPIRHEAWWYSEQGVISAFHLESRLPMTPEAPQVLCEAMSCLASVLPVDYGHVDLRFEGQDPATAMKPGGSAHHLGAYGRLGPEALFPRTFIGPRLLRILGGPDALPLSGAALHTLENGMLQVDLVPEPWTQDARALKDAQVTAMAELRLTGILAQPLDRWRIAPGPRWQPLLGDVAAHGEQGSPFIGRT
jgi:hypothetical protein